MGVAVSLHGFTTTKLLKSTIKGVTEIAFVSATIDVALAEASIATIASFLLNVGAVVDHPLSTYPEQSLLTLNPV